MSAEGSGFRLSQLKTLVDGYHADACFLLECYLYKGLRLKNSLDGEINPKP